MKVICLIPARLDSQRFHRKIMADLGGLSLLGRVIEAAKKISYFDEIYVAGCSDEVIQEAQKHGVKGYLTDPNLPNGTMRIISAVDDNQIEGDIFINLQADEPFINEEAIKVLLEERGDSDICTLKTKINDEKADKPSVVKVVSDKANKALYFSRSKIPFQKTDKAKYYKHIGLYGFTKSALEKIKNLEATELEKSESLEQLRWLENGLTISVSEVKADFIGIDTEEDLLEAKNIVLNQEIKIK